MTGRTQAARQRAAHVKRRITLLAAAGFVATFGLAAASHSGASTSDDTTAVEQPAAADTGTFDFGTGDVAPSAGNTPQVQTRTS